MLPEDQAVPAAHQGVAKNILVVPMWFKIPSKWPASAIRPDCLCNARPCAILREFSFHRAFNGCPR